MLQGILSDQAGTAVWASGTLVSESDPDQFDQFPLPTSQALAPIGQFVPGTAGTSLIQ